MSADAMDAAVLIGASAEREAAERSLSEAGVVLDATTRLIMRSVTRVQTGLVVVRPAGSPRPVWGLGFHLRRHRVLPGFTSYWVPSVRLARSDWVRFGLRGLVEHARRGRVLRVEARAFGTTPEERSLVESLISEGGLLRSENPSSYTKTLFTDLRTSADTLLAGFHKTARQNIRVTDRRPVRVLPMRDPALAPRMNELFEATMQRTGGSRYTEDWGAWMRLADEAPDVVCVIGMFHAERSGPEALLSFAVGVRHREIAQYMHGASTRESALKIPLLYSPLWQMMLWAKESGAEWFDFGGVTTADDNDDSIGGISSFKRYFSRDLRVVGSEFGVTVSPVWSATAAAMRTLAAPLRALVRRTSTA